MAPNETAEEVEVRAFFETDLGLVVTRIPESSVPTPDFLIDGDGPGYLVEVKGRFDDRKSKAAFAAGKFASGAESLGWAPWTSNTVRNARNQLVSWDPAHERLWVLCFVIRRSHAIEAVFNQVIGSLYGVRQVAYWDGDEGRALGRECLHAVPGSFERWPDIDSAVISSGGAVTLCVNEFSPRLAESQSSRLFGFFAERGGPIRASDLEKTKGFWAVGDLTIDRSDQRAIENHLARKYAVNRVVLLDIQSHYASAIVARDPG